nr:MAG TPA: hypothetical protein [Caudoviricetes sp.]
MSVRMRTRKREFILALQEERSNSLCGFQKPEKKEVTQKRIKRQVELQFKRRDTDL